MLELKNVQKFYTTNGVTNLGLRNVNLKFHKNEIVCIVGESGSGKSTLLNVITKNDVFDEGEIYYKGNETSYFSINDMDNFRKNKVGFIFQNYNIIDSYTVLENVMVPLLLKGYKKAEAKKEALKLINKVGLLGKEKNRGTKLSGGEKQRCVIARALASDCEILACDEPTGNLDSKTSKEIINLIKEVAGDKLVLIVTHNFEDFTDVATRKIKMADGEVVEDVLLKDEVDYTLENEVLDLDYKPIPRKINLALAKNNTVFTPKKSIFIMTIFLVINLITLFLFQTIYESNVSVSRINDYQMLQQNRYFVYSKEGIEISLDEIKKNDKIDQINPYTFVDDETVELYQESNKDDNYFIGTITRLGITTYMPKDSKLFKEINKDGEFDIVVENDSYVLNVLENKPKDTLIYITNGNKTNSKTNTTFKLRNVYTTAENMNRFNGYAIFDNKIIEGFSNLLNVNVSIDNKKVSVSYLPSKDNSLKLVLPKEYETQNIGDLTFEGIYNYSIKNVLVSYEDVTSITLYSSLESLPCFEASVYSEKNITKDMTKLNLLCDDVCNLQNEDSKLGALITNLVTYILIILCSFLLIAVFFITYFILAKVYQSKSKDYQILRTLGVTKNDMAKTVKYEVLMLAGIAMVVALIIFVLLITFVEFMQTKTTFMLVLIYFIVSYIFALRIAKRFNKKLFKFSISKSLKEGE